MLEFSLNVYLTLKDLVAIFMFIAMDSLLYASLRQFGHYVLIFLLERKFFTTYGYAILCVTRKLITCVLLRFGTNQDFYV
jgi:hypothetical protein